MMDLGDEERFTRPFPKGVSQVEELEFLKMQVKKEECLGHLSKVFLHVNEPLLPGMCEILVHTT